MWKQRCHHHHDTTKTSNWYREHLHNTVDQLYAQKPILDHKDQFILHDHPKNIKKLKNTQIENYIQRTQLRLQPAIKRALKRQKQKTPPITKYLDIHTKPKSKTKSVFNTTNKHISPTTHITQKITKFFTRKPTPAEPNNKHPP